MKLLFLTPQLPYPPHKGTSMRNLYLMRHLAQHHRIRLLSFLEEDQNAAWVSRLQALGIQVDMVPAPRRSSRLSRLLTTFFSPQPDMALRLASAKFADRLRALLRENSFAAVQIEGLEMAPYMKVVQEEAPGVLLVLDDHNAEYLLQRRAYEVARSSVRAWTEALYSFIQWHKLRSYERAACARAQLVVTVSEPDRRAVESLGVKTPVAVVPNGIDPEYYARMGRKETDERRSHILVFTGTMDFRPNVDAMVWFCHRVLPLIQLQDPRVNLLIVGRNPARAVRWLARASITVTGAVPDVRNYLLDAQVYVVPIRIGGGVRFKMLEALASGIPVVSTSLGAEGIAAVPEEHFLLADDPQTFAQQVMRLLRDPELAQGLAARGIKLVREHYDWQHIVPHLEEAYQQCLGLR